MSERSCAHVARAQLPEYLEFSAAMLFRGSLNFFTPPTTTGPLPAHLRTFAPPSGLLGPCFLCPLLLPNPLTKFQADPPLRERRRFALALVGSDSAVHCSPPTQGPCGTAPWQRQVPAIANPCGGIRVFTSGGAPAPRPSGGGPVHCRLCGTTYTLPLARLASGRLPFIPSPRPSSCLRVGPERSQWASLGPSSCPREPLSWPG